jgi:hypothetical protein
MNQAIQDIAPADADTIAWVERWIGQSFRRPQAETSMRPSGVVVSGVGLKDSLQMAAAEDRNPVEAFGSDRADPPFH